MSHFQNIILLLAMNIAVGDGLFGIRHFEDGSNIANREVKRAGVYKSTDSGVTWLPIGDGLPDDIQASFFEKMGDEVFMATDNRGLFVSAGLRSSWKKVNTIPDFGKINALSAYNGELYIGAYQRGIFMSSDRGISWNNLNDNLPDLRIQAILSRKGVLLAGTDRGIFKRDANGKQWRARFSDSQVVSLNEYNGRFIAGTANGILMSSDQGETWQFIHRNGALHTTEIADEKIFGLYISGEVWMSDDWGVNWSQCIYNPHERSYVYALTKSNNYLVMCNSYGVFRSGNQGRSWDHIFQEEKFAFLDLIEIDGVLYGGTRATNEFRNRK